MDSKPSELWEINLCCLKATLSLVLCYSSPNYGSYFQVTMVSNEKSAVNLIKDPCSVQFSHSVVSHSLQPHELQHARPPCPSPTPGVYSNSCPWSWWCYPTISSSVTPFSSCLQSFPKTGSFQMNQLFASGGQRIGVSASASVLPMNIQDWFPLGWTDWISLKSKRLSRVFSSTKIWKHKFKLFN